MACKDLLVNVSISSLLLSMLLWGGNLYAADQPANGAAVNTKPAAVATEKKKVSAPKESTAAAESAAEINQVSKNIQQLKSQVIDLNKDLRLMEEKLLFPSSTKYSVFVSLSSGQFFTLEGIKLKIDEKLVSTHIYSEKQRQAMIRGGIHKFYITNLNEGTHSATLFFTGIGPGGRAYKRASTIDFTKGANGEYLEVAISDDSVTQEPVFTIKQW